MTLTDLPDIGPVLAEHLRAAGIHTPEQLREIGAAEAFLRIRTAVDPTICLHALEALAGAVEGVRKSALPADRKAELKRWFNDVTRGIKTGV